MMPDRQPWYRILKFINFCELFLFFVRKAAHFRKPACESAILWFGVLRRGLIHPKLPELTSEQNELPSTTTIVLQPQESRSNADIASLIPIALHVRESLVANRLAAGGTIPRYAAILSQQTVLR